MVGGVFVALPQGAGEVALLLPAQGMAVRGNRLRCVGHGTSRKGDRWTLRGRA